MRILPAPQTFNNPSPIGYRDCYLQAVFAYAGDFPCYGIDGGYRGWFKIAVFVFKKVKVQPIRARLNIIENGVICPSFIQNSQSGKIRIIKSSRNNSRIIRINRINRIIKTHRIIFPNGRGYLSRAFGFGTILRAVFGNKIIATPIHTHIRSTGGNLLYRIICIASRIKHIRTKGSGAEISRHHITTRGCGFAVIYNTITRYQKFRPYPLMSTFKRGSIHQTIRYPIVSFCPVLIAKKFASLIKRIAGTGGDKCLCEWHKAKRVFAVCGILTQGDTRLP